MFVFIIEPLMDSHIDSILKSETQAFIREHEKDDIQKLLLQHKSIHGVPTAVIADQISGRRKSKLKLPTLYGLAGIVFPPSLNLEQCSSEATGLFKTDLLKQLGINLRKVADLTGGFGIDTYFLGAIAERVHFVETESSLLALARHNHKVLGARTIQYHHQKAENFLNDWKERFDLIYVDPSRRKNGKKIFRLSDCEPDIISLQKHYFDRSDNWLVKTSPLLDISQGCKELTSVKQVFVLSVENDCKELLFHIENSFQDEPTIHAVDLQKNGIVESFVSFKSSVEKVSKVHFSDPQKYLYEPNISILKAGAFKWIGQEFELSKLAPNTHLYTSEKIVHDFPGRIFRILQSTKPDKIALKLFSDGYANILTRNYPLTVEAIKKKTGLKEGGEKYLICTQGENQKFTLMAERIK